MLMFLDDLVNRLFERETLVVIAAFAFLYMGKVSTAEEAVTLAATVMGLLAQRGYVKGLQAREATAEALAFASIPMGAPLPKE